MDKRENLSLEEFVREYEAVNKPVILRGVMDSWRAMEGWTVNQLLEKYGDTFFKTNGTDEDGHR